METIGVLSGLLPVALVGMLIWFLWSGSGRGGSTPDIDAAATVRRFFLYGLLYVTLLVAAQGLIELFDELLGSDRRSNAALARALAFLVVGGPAATGLVYYVDRRLHRSADERRSPAWTVYLNAALLTTLIGAMIEGHAVLTSAMAPAEDRSFEADQLAAAAIWSGLWLLHWFFLLRRHGVSGDLHLSAGTTVGLLTMAAGFGGLLYIGADELYTVITDDPLTDRGGPSFGAWMAAAIVGGLVWGWYWLVHYRPARRTELWYVTVVPIGALAGFAVAVAMSATLLHTMAVWYLGDPDATTAVRHFDVVPGLAGTLTVAAAAWLYHRSLLGRETVRSNAIRSYDYLLAMAALITGVVGLVLLMVALFDAGETAVTNTVLAGLTMVLVGGPIWWWFWTTIKGHVANNRTAELASPLRRIYLFSLFGVGGLAVLIGGLAALTGGFEDLLDGNLSRRTLHDNRVGLAVVIAVIGVAWYHFGVYRRERDDYRPAPPPAPTRRSQRIILVSPDEDHLSRELAEATGAAVVSWHRTDGQDRAGTTTVNIEELGHLVTEREEDDLLVLVGDDGPKVIPFTRSESEPHRG